MNRFQPGNIVRHFKRETISQVGLRDNPTIYLYEIIGYGKHTETKEEFVVYKTLYNLGDVKIGNIYIRPKEMFESKVDTNKYPDIKQEYRFELFNA